MLFVLKEWNDKFVLVWTSDKLHPTNSGAIQPTIGSTGFDTVTHQAFSYPEKKLPNTSPYRGSTESIHVPNFGGRYLVNVCTIDRSCKQILAQLWLATLHIWMHSAGTTHFCTQSGVCSSIRQSSIHFSKVALH